ncbi:MAG: polysaccharide biosynthesis/export family protein [Thermoguttaceae bacterium]
MVEAKRQVHGPAIGLLVTGILNWVVLTGVAIGSANYSLHSNDASYAVGVSHLPIIVAIAFLCGMMMIFAALKMERLQAYGLAITASILAIIVSPSNLIGLPIGIWALVVLSNPDTRNAFVQNSRRKSGDTNVSVTSTQRILAIVALVLFLAALPSAGVIVTIAGLARRMVFPISFAMELAAFILGFVSWKLRAAKIAVIGSGCLLLVAMALLVTAMVESTKPIPRDFGGVSGYRATPLDREKAKLAREVAQAELQDAEQKAKAGKNAEFPATVGALTTVPPLDVLQIRVMGTMIDQPIDGFYLVEPDGNVALGPLYGRVNVQGLTMEQAEATVAKQLHKTLPQADVQVTLARRGAAWRKVVFTRSPYEIEPMDVLQVHVVGAFFDQPIDGFFLVETGGSIALGPAYGRAKVKGMSFEAAERTVRRQLQRVLRKPAVQITLPTRGKLPGAEWRETTPPTDSYRIDVGDLLFVDAAGTAPDGPIHDIYLVEPAGTLALGPLYERVVVKGLTLKDAEKAIQKKLREVVSKPAVSVTLAGWANGEMVPGGRVPSRPRTQDSSGKTGERKTAQAAKKNHFEQGAKKPSTNGLSPSGAVLVYEVEPSSTSAGASASDTDKLLKVMDLRLNAGSKKLAQVRKLDDRRIEVTLMRPDAADRKRVERLLASPGTLEFRILASARQNKALVERAEKETDQSEIRDASGNLLAWWAPVRDGEDQRLDRFDAAQRLKRRAQEKVLEVLVIADPYNVTGAYLTKAEVQRDHNGRPCIGFTLNDAGGKLLAKLTSDHLPDKQTGFAYRLGIILDGEQWSAPFIMSVIREKGQITGIFTQQQAQEIADVLNAGTLPACRLKLQPARPKKSDSHRMDSMNRLKTINLAIHGYASSHQVTFPPAYVAGKDGKPLLSWRVLILPYLEQNELFKQFHLDEPWDSPHNKRLIAKMPDVYRSPRSSVSDSWKTNYLTVRGANTIFSGAKGIGFGDVRDGTSNTIMTVEVPDAQAVVWTKPDDIPYNLQNPNQGLFGLWPDGFLAGLADGSVRFVSSSIEPKVLKALLTRNGGEHIEPDDFDRFFR